HVGADELVIFDAAAVAVECHAHAFARAVAPANTSAIAATGDATRRHWPGYGMSANAVGVEAPPAAGP
ncbi:MAG: hypothetical protein ABI831_28800, partial [Betaproteobacteria bacterium]